MLTNEKELKAQRLVALMDEAWTYTDDELGCMPIILLDRVQKQMIHFSLRCRKSMYRRTPEEDESEEN